MLKDFFLTAIRIVIRGDSLKLHGVVFIRRWFNTTFHNYFSPMALSRDSNYETLWS